MKRFLLLPIDHPYVEVECGEKKLDTLSIKDMREDPLFPYPVLTFVMVRQNKLAVVFQFNF